MDYLESLGCLMMDYLESLQCLKIDRRKCASNESLYRSAVFEKPPCWGCAHEKSCQSPCTTFRLYLEFGDKWEEKHSKVLKYKQSIRKKA